MKYRRRRSYRPPAPRFWLHKDVDGNFLTEIPLDVGGYISRLKIPDIASKLEAFQKTIESLDSGLPFAHLTLNVLTTAAIPFIRMTEKG